MTREERVRVEKHFDELYKASGITLPDDIRQSMKNAYIAGADYAIDMFAPRWISVEDELPLEDGDILVYCADGVGVWEYDKSYNGQYMNDYNHITHWMPLPQSPSSTEQPNNYKKGGEQ